MKTETDVFGEWIQDRVEKKSTKEAESQDDEQVCKVITSILYNLFRSLVSKMSLPKLMKL